MNSRYVKGPKKSEVPDAKENKAPYIEHYPHSVSRPVDHWNNIEYFQVISIDPAEVNLAFRIERRYLSGAIVTIAFEKACVKEVVEVGDIILCNTYRNTVNLLQKYAEYLPSTHIIAIERQMHFNYKAVRVAQCIIDYYTHKCADMPLLPSIYEINSKLKGQMLGAPKGLNDKAIKTWAIGRARELLAARGDMGAIAVMDYWKVKQDDLADTVCQVEALFAYWKLPVTKLPIKVTVVPETIVPVVPVKPVVTTRLVLPK